MAANAQGITMRQLQIFTAVADQGSFTRAAETLFLTESAVSQQVRLLESLVGARLLDRPRGRVVAVTASGRRLLSASNTISLVLAKALEEVDELESGTRMSVSLGVGLAFCAHLLPHLCASFRQSRSDIAIRVDTSLKPELLNKVLRKELDLAVVIGDVNVPNLQSAPLGDLDLVFIGQAEVWRDVGSPIPFHVVAAQRLLVGTDYVRELLDARAAMEGIDLNIGWEVRSIEAQVAAVADGLGVALVPSYSVAAHLADGTCRFIPVHGFPVRATWHLAWRIGGLSPAAKDFKEYLLTQRTALEAMTLRPLHKVASPSTTA